MAEGQADILNKNVPKTTSDTSPQFQTTRNPPLGIILSKKNHVPSHTEVKVKKIFRCVFTKHPMPFKETKEVVGMDKEVREGKKRFFFPFPLASSNKIFLAKLTLVFAWSPVWPHQSLGITWRSNCASPGPWCCDRKKCIWRTQIRSICPGGTLIDGCRLPTAH